MPKKYPIDLGKSMPGIPSGVLAVTGSDDPVKDEMFYPSVQLEWEDDYDLPESGEITFRFEKTSETNNKDGQTVSLDLTKILSASPDKEKDEESTGERLDKEFKKETKKAKRRERLPKRDVVVVEDDEEVIY